MLTLRPPAEAKDTDSGIKQEKSKVPISMAGMKKIGRKVCVSTSKFLPRNTTDYIDPYDTQIT